MVDINKLTITTAHEALVNKDITATELVKYHLGRLSEIDREFGISISEASSLDNQAMLAAKVVDEKIGCGEKIGLLEGIPYTAKDMFLTAGVATTAASKILKYYIPPYSATVIEKLNKAGAILIAKVNQDEFAQGGSTENSAYHPTYNPYNKSKVPGGSSGGSATAVAAGVGLFSLGTDTGGSIRQPAAYCGVVGYKPSYGLVSRYGVVAMASSLDCIGPITKNVQDAAIVLEVIASRDPLDSTTVEIKDYNFSSNDIQTEKIRLGYSTEYQTPHLVNDDFDLLKSIERANSDIELKPNDNQQNATHMLACYYILVPSEISSNLSRYDGIRYGASLRDTQDLQQIYSKTRANLLGPEVKRRILIGTYSLSAGYYDAYYKQAMKLRTKICDQFNEMFKSFDALIMPTTLSPAFGLGEKSDPVEMYKTDRLTVSANIAGLPAISIPTRLVDGLPVGLQIIAPHGKDKLVFDVAKKLEKLIPAIKEPV